MPECVTKKQPAKDGRIDFAPVPAHNGSSACRHELALRFSLEVCSIVTLVQLARRLAIGTVDHTPSLHGRPLQECVGPAINGRMVVRTCPFCAACHVHTPKEGLRVAPCSRGARRLEYLVTRRED